MLPFATLAFAGALLAGEFLKAGCFEHDESLRPLLLVTSVPSAALLGRVLEWCAARWPLRQALLACVVGTGGLAIACGAFVGGIGWPPSGVTMGAADGLAAAVPFALVFAAALIAATSSPGARPGSVIAGSQGASVWLVVACGVAIGTLAALPGVHRYARCPDSPSVLGLALAGVAELAALGLVLHSGLRLRRVKRLADAATRDASHLRQVGAFGVPFVDLGVGDALREVAGAGGTAYRDRTPPRHLVRGDLALAARALSAALRRSAVGALLASGALLVGLLGAR